MSDRQPQTHDHYPFIKFEPKGATTSTGFPSGGLPYLACGCGWNDLGDTGWTDHLEDEASRGPDLAALSDLRKEVVHDFLDPCFCDDLAEECVACSRIRGVLALIDKRLEAPRG